MICSVHSLSHLQQWSPQLWPGAARQWRLCQWNFLRRGWTQSCCCPLLLQNQARSSPTPDGNQRTSSWCRNDSREDVVLFPLHAVMCWLVAVIYYIPGSSCKLIQSLFWCLKNMQVIPLSLVVMMWDSFRGNFPFPCQHKPAGDNYRAASSYVSVLHRPGG